MKFDDSEENMLKITNLKKRDWWESYCCEKCQWNHKNLDGNASWQTQIETSGSEHDRTCSCTCYGCKRKDCLKGQHMCSYEGMKKIVQHKWDMRAITYEEMPGSDEIQVITHPEIPSKQLDKWHMMKRQRECEAKNTGQEAQKPKKSKTD